MLATLLLLALLFSFLVTLAHQAPVPGDRGGPWEAVRSGLRELDRLARDRPGHPAR